LQFYQVSYVKQAVLSNILSSLPSSSSVTAAAAAPVVVAVAAAFGFCLTALFLMVE